MIVTASAALPVGRARCPKMAMNPKPMGKRDSECTKTGELHQEGGEPPKNSTATSATANQNGDQPGCGDSVLAVQEAPERRRNVQADARCSSSSPLPGPRRGDELPRKNFQIPRKIRERKGGATQSPFCRSDVCSCMSLAAS